MKEYKKPNVLVAYNELSLIPVAVAAISGLASSAAATAAGGVAGLAFAAGVASGLMKDNKSLISRVPSLGRVFA